MKQPVLQIDTATLLTRSETMPRVVFVAEHGKVWQVCRDGLAPLVFTSPVALACAFELDGDELLHRAAILDGWRPTQVLVYRTADDLVERRALLFEDESGQMWTAAQWLSGVPGKMAPGAGAGPEARWHVLDVGEYLHTLAMIIAGCGGMRGMVKLFNNPARKPVFLPALDAIEKAIAQTRTLAEKERTQVRALDDAMSVVR